MSDKSQLEKDIERRELVKVPFSVLVLIALLSMALGAMGVYTFKLKQEIRTREHEIRLRQEEIMSMRRDFDNEKAEFMAVIKKLETEKERPESGLESMSGAQRVTPPASSSVKGEKDSAE